MDNVITRRCRCAIRQGARDFALGLGLFAAVAIAGSYVPSRSSAQHAPIFSSTAYAAAPHASWAVSNPMKSTPIVYRSTDTRAATVILGLTFASLFAFNMGLFRHLRRVYASPR